MAQVYLAQKDGSPDICVLKQLLGELAGHATAGKRFYREAHVASYLSHPNIARTIDAGFEDDAFCIAMEFISGRDVESMMHLLMRQGRMLPYEVSLAVTLGVLDGLAYAHDALDPEGNRLEVVHRDLSPRNIMLSFDGEVKIIDFGLARGRVDDFKTAPGMILGTLRYVSPEQAVADPIDRRSDLYSIAVVLYEMLTGRPLVSDGKPLEVLTEVVNRVPSLLSEMNPHLPIELDDVLAKALEKAPADRWQDAKAFADALRTAAGPLAQAPQESLGQFARSLFPKEQARAEHVIALGRLRYESLQRGDDEDVAMMTRAGVLPSDLESTDDLGSQTKTGYASDLTRTSFEPTRVATDETAMRTMLVRSSSTRATLLPNIVENLAATAVVAPFADTRIVTQVGPSRTPSVFRVPRQRSSWPWALAGSIIALGLAGFGAYRIAVPEEPQAVPLEAVIEPVKPALVAAHPAAIARNEGIAESAEIKAPANSPPPTHSPRPRPSPEASAKPAAPEPLRPLPEPAKAKPPTRQRSVTQRLEAMKQAQSIEEQQIQDVIATLNAMADKDPARYREALANIEMASRKLSERPVPAANLAKALDKLLQAARVIDP